MRPPSSNSLPGRQHSPPQRQSEPRQSLRFHRSRGSKGLAESAAPVATENVFEPMVDPREVYPEYLTDPAILVCPSDATLTTDAWTTDVGGTYFHKVCEGDDDHGSRAGQDSYLYFGHIFDQCDSTDRTIDGALLGLQQTRAISVCKAPCGMSPSARLPVGRAPAPNLRFSKMWILMVPQQPWVNPQQEIMETAGVILFFAIVKASSVS